jgi:hypothetical protein
MNASLQPQTKVRKAIDVFSGASTLDVLIEMAEGNPGAITALGQIVNGDIANLIDVLHLDDMNIRGCQIWVGFKDHCKQDVEVFRKAIRARDPAMVDTINRICVPQIGERAVAHGASFKR